MHDLSSFAYIGMIAIFFLSMWAQFKVKGNFTKYSRVPSTSGLTGAQAADRMLRAEGVTDVRIERGSGFLSDHYDARQNVIRLSPEVHDSSSIAALGVACHEAGHALQKARSYGPLVIRNMAVPVASFAPNVGMVLIVIGLVMGAGARMGGIGFPIAIAGLLLFSAAALFQIINLPVEFNATARAKKALVDTGIIQRGAESQGVDKVLNAAALTYVAATAGAIMSVLYYAMIIFGGRRN